MKIEALQLTQRIMAQIAKEHPSTINRFILNNNISHVETGHQRNLKYNINESRDILKKFVSERLPIKKKGVGILQF